MFRTTARRWLLALTIACAAALTFAATASSYPVIDASVPVVAVTTGTPTTDPPATAPAPAPDPAPATCPDTPAGTDPIAACPFDPDEFYLWPGDDADAPLWTHCNYYSGDPNQPCPHSTASTPSFFIRCNDTGVVWSVERYGDADDPAADRSQEHADQACSGGWTDLSTP